MIHGIGIDILHLPRLTRLLEKPYSSRFARRILTHDEYSTFSQLPTSRRLAFLATRWTLKEAAWKATQPYPSSWKDASISHIDGRPVIKNDLFDFMSSVSHDGEYCTSFVIAMKKPDGRGTGSMIKDYDLDFPRHKTSADDWVEKW